MTKAEAKTRIGKLRQAIDKYRYEYHVLDKSSISDSALDQLKHELFKLETEHPDLITSDSPTQRVGGEPLPKFKKVTHSAPMLSMEDVFTAEEFESWEKRNSKLLPTTYSLLPSYFCMPKIDGLAVSLVYEDGLLKSAATRGDGKVGEDITLNVRTMESVPLHLDARRRGGSVTLPPRVEIRGEIYMKLKDFDALNKQYKKNGEPLLVNPRNASAGSVRQLDPKITASRKLSFVAWDLVSDLGQKSQSHEWEILRELGFKPTPDSIVAKSFHDVQKQWHALQKKREKMGFWIDGMVVRVDDNDVYQSLGVVGKTPRGLIAWKFPAEEATTKVVEVNWSVGRTGKLTPVATVEPTFIAGTTVVHATLHNADEIGRLGLKIGDTVILTKAGDVIPKITKTLTELRSGKEKTIHLPTKCPVCGSEVRRRDGEVDIVCTNKQCFAHQFGAIIHAVSAFEMMGVGEKIVERLLQLGLVKTAPDLFRLKEDDLRELEGFGDVSAKKIVGEIQSKKTIELGRFIAGLGINNVGEETAFDLAEHFLTIDKLEAADREQLESVKGIGTIVADSVLEYFGEASNRKIIKDFHDVGVKIKTPEKRSGKLSGQTFVITGTLEAMSRDEAKDKIRALGGDPTETVSKKTSFVVVGAEPGSKAEKAKKLGVKTLSESEFLSML